MRPVEGQYQPRIDAIPSKFPVMIWQMDAPGAPGPPWFVISSSAVLPAAVTVQTVFAIFGGGAAQAAAVVSKATVAMASMMVRFMVNSSLGLELCCFGRIVRVSTRHITLRASCSSTAAPRSSRPGAAGDRAAPAPSYDVSVTGPLGRPRGTAHEPYAFRS